MEGGREDGGRRKEGKKGQEERIGGGERQNLLHCICIIPLMTFGLELLKAFL